MLECTYTVYMCLWLCVQKGGKGKNCVIYVMYESGSSNLTTICWERGTSVGTEESGRASALGLRDAPNTIERIALSFVSTLLLDINSIDSDKGNDSSTSAQLLRRHDANARPEHLVSSG